jgi:hypothetical protein
MQNEPKLPDAKLLEILEVYDIVCERTKDVREQFGLLKDNLSTQELARLHEYLAANDELRKQLWREMLEEN